MNEAPSTFMLMLRLGVSLGLVLALVGVVTWVLRRRGLLRPAGANSTGRLEILDRKALGKRASLVVARVGGTAVLVGVTDTHVSVLSQAPGLDAAWDGAAAASVAVIDAVGHHEPEVELDLTAPPTTASPSTADVTPATITPATITPAALAAASSTTGARRTGLRADSRCENATTTRMSLVEALRERTVRRS